jgi:UDPglucose--hexose-1-phosphate uridylyltransferase
MHLLRLVKPDGRRLILYTRDEVGPPTAPSGAPVPEGITVRPNPHLRWHPLRREWVAYASHRQNRTFLPPPEYNPLAPTRPDASPTELPAGTYDVAVFENLFPSLTLRAGRPPDDLWLPVASGQGVCEVVVFTQDPSSSLAALPLARVELVIEVWGHRTAEIGAIDSIEYVMPFENRGVEVGVTLHHPHGQIYAYPFVPPLPAREHASAVAHHREHGRTLLEVMVDSEEKDGRRMLASAAEAVAFVPACARYPYEAWIVPRRPVARLDEITVEARRDLAAMLQAVLRMYQGLWGELAPYLMAVHQGPTDGQAHPEIHLHIELSPARRSKDRLKFLAGTELAAGMFANDSLPEEKAKELRAAGERRDG